MKIQTLIVTTGQTDHSLLDRMNVQTDALVGNQCDRNEIEEFTHNGHTIRWFSMRERGVGLNRNTVMMRADADVCVFADDDMVFHDGYTDTVAQMFEQHPDADIILFNVDEKVPKRYKNTKVVPIGRKNYGKYGAARVAFRRERVHMAGVAFHLMFGGGAKYSSGEDSIFLRECLEYGLKMLAVPVAIAELHETRESTWFTGYNDKFFYDKGVLYAHLYGKSAYLIALYNCFKHRKGHYREYGWRNAYRRACEGIRSRWQSK
ncbi:MAG: glycosyltransferase [Ruminococcaceae bacterium]|nr:glycosyltransferase [Oscillospiraceae bacterium]